MIKVSNEANCFPDCCLNNNAAATASGGFPGGSQSSATLVRRAEAPQRNSFILEELAGEPRSPGTRQILLCISVSCHPLQSLVVAAAPCLAVARSAPWALRGPVPMDGQM